MAAVIYLIVEPRVYGGSLPPSLVVFLHGCCVDILKEALCAGQIRIPLGSRERKGRRHFRFTLS